MTDSAVIINAKSHIFMFRGVFHIDDFHKGVTILHRRKKQTWQEVPEAQHCAAALLYLLRGAETFYSSSSVSHDLKNCTHGESGSLNLTKWQNFFVSRNVDIGSGFFLSFLSYISRFLLNKSSRWVSAMAAALHTGTQATLNLRYLLEFTYWLSISFKGKTVVNLRLSCLYHCLPSHSTQKHHTTCHWCHNASPAVPHSIKTGWDTENMGNVF